MWGKVVFNTIGRLTHTKQKDNHFQIICGTQNLFHPIGVSDLPLPPSAWIKCQLCCNDLCHDTQVLRCIAKEGSPLAWSFFFWGLNTESGFDHDGFRTVGCIREELRREERRKEGKENGEWRDFRRTTINVYKKCNYTTTQKGMWRVGVVHVLSTARLLSGHVPEWRKKGMGGRKRGVVGRTVSLI